VFEHHPDGTVTQFLRVPSLSSHSSNLSRVGASGKTGSVQCPKHVKRWASPPPIVQGDFLVRTLT
jgi:hypothetical protein